ncbi:hypothetical protein ABFS83_08G010700 [Erythranthe nasuta]
MEDRNPSPASSSSSSAALERHRSRNRRRAVGEEEDGGDPVAAACTGKSCQSCTAEVIADCVAVCCCPCSVVNFLALALLKLPWAVARKYLGGLKKKSRRRRRMLEERKCCRKNDRDGNSGNESLDDGTSEICLPPAGDGICEAAASGNLGTAEEVWLELYEVGHLNFGRVSFTGLPFHNKGN